MIDYRCETGTVDRNARQPVIRKCGKPATHFFGQWQSAVCDECLPIMQAKYPAHQATPISRRRADAVKP